MSIQTAERVSFSDESDGVIYFRHEIAYTEAKKRISGKVLEIGCGEGYGVRILSPNTTHYVAIDKYEPDIDFKAEGFEKVSFKQITIPPLAGLEDNTFDYAVSFQVIEHIKEDHDFVKEIHRVLKPGGKLILTTPNKKMSLTRNPWHIREYFTNELQSLLEKDFSSVEMNGVYGDGEVMKYYEKNKVSVKKITRFDIFNLQYILPRFILQIPYDLLNRMNRRKLMKENTKVVTSINEKSFFIKPETDDCFDFFCVAEK